MSYVSYLIVIIVILILLQSELLNFPDELRGVLEECLSEEASSATLDRYLPQVRSIVTNLLKGLRGKQHIFRQLVSNNRPKSDASGHTRSDSGGQMSRSSRTHARRDTQNSVSSTEDGFSRRTTQSSVGSFRRKESATYDPASNGFVGGFTFPVPMPQPNPAQPPNSSDRPSRLPSNPRPPSAPGVSIPSTPPLPDPDPDPEATPIPPFRASAPQVPASVKRYSLVDKPALPPPSVVVDDSSSHSPTETDRSNTQSPPPELPAVDNLTANPGVASSLAALKKSDLLERRASKRFSTYNISKMTGAPRGGRSDLGTGSGHPNRRSLVAGGGGNLTAKELSVLTEEADEEFEPPPAIPQQSPRRQRSFSRPRGPPPSEIVEERPPVPPLPRVLTPATPQPPPAQAPAESSSAAKPLPSAPGVPESITVFMQVGREVRKAKVEPGLTFSSLRVLFVDKFAYNPGQEDFPAIYIRDPSSGVQYELEDPDEIKDNCLLSLNIEREYCLWARAMPCSLIANL